MNQACGGAVKASDGFQGSRSQDDELREVPPHGTQCNHPPKSGDHATQPQAHPSSDVTPSHFRSLCCLTQISPARSTCLSHTGRHITHRDIYSTRQTADPLFHGAVITPPPGQPNTKRKPSAPLALPLPHPNNHPTKQNPPPPQALKIKKHHRTPFQPIPISHSASTNPVLTDPPDSRDSSSHLIKALSGGWRGAVVIIASNQSRSGETGQGTEKRVRNRRGKGGSTHGCEEGRWDGH